MAQKPETKPKPEKKPPPKPEPHTITMKVYGPPFEVHYNTILNDNDQTVLVLDREGERIKLNPSQESLANQLFLHEYVEAVFPKDPSGGDGWMEGVLDDIIVKRCRDDPSVDISRCINFAAYLMKQAGELRRNATKLPFVAKDRIGSKDEIQKKKTEAEKRKKDRESGRMYGNITVTITIKLSDILDSDETKEYTDCSDVEAFKSITDAQITELIEKDDMWEALYMIAKQYRGKTCEATNLLANSLNYDDDILALLNPGGYFFSQYEKLYELHNLVNT